VSTPEARALLTEILSSGRISHPDALSHLEKWLMEPAFADFIPDIDALVRSGDWTELEDSFYRRVPIGTGGIRGRLGVGPNRINKRTIAVAAQALSQFIAAQASGSEGRGVVVGHEARRDSEAFARLCCEVFARNGIRALPFPPVQGLALTRATVRSTPEVSFAVRRLGALAGVQITASHNPLTDNGFKFYWSTGGQVVPPLDARFMKFVEDVPDELIDTLPYEEALEQGLITPIPSEIDEAYWNSVRSLTIDRNARSAHIVYGAMHGAGATNVLPVLLAEGFRLDTIAEQLEPNEAFPDAVGDLINPEYIEVMQRPMEMAERTGADLALCSDPDADRIGVAAKISIDEDELMLLTGNQVAALMTQYMLERKSQIGSVSADDYVLATYVTTSLVSDIAAHFGAKCKSDFLVGFKWMADYIEHQPDKGTAHFLLAAEESLGYMAGNFVRDKDAAIAALLIGEMASWLKEQERTLADYLDEIYRRHGYYRNLQWLIELPGRSGEDIMREVMAHLRLLKPGDTVSGVEIVAVEDWWKQAPAGATYRVGAAEDMVTVVLSDDRKCRATIRPSGTEPKLKFYVQIYDERIDDLAGAKERADVLAHRVATGLADYSRMALREGALQQWVTAQTSASRFV